MSSGISNQAVCVFQQTEILMIIPVLLGKTVFISCCTCSPCSAQLMMSCSDISAQKQTRNNHCKSVVLPSVTINYQQLLLIVHTMLSDVHIPADKLIQNFAILRTFVLNASWKLSSSGCVLPYLCIHCFDSFRHDVLESRWHSLCRKHW